jgi:hypothetical protein
MLAIVLGFFSFADEVTKPVFILALRLPGLRRGFLARHRGHPYWAIVLRESLEGDNQNATILNFLALKSFKKFATNTLARYHVI